MYVCAVCVIMPLGRESGLILTLGKTMCCVHALSSHYCAYLWDQLLDIKEMLHISRHLEQHSSGSLKLYDTEPPKSVESNMSVEMLSFRSFRFLLQ